MYHGGSASGDDVVEAAPSQDDMADSTGQSGVDIKRRWVDMKHLETTLDKLLLAVGLHEQFVPQLVG